MSSEDFATSGIYRRVVEYRLGFLQRRYRMPSDMFVYPLSYGSGIEWHKTPDEAEGFYVNLAAAKRLFAMLEALVLEHIALADRHLREAEERIAAQRLRVANSVAQEREKVEALLETFLQILDQMRKHRALLDEELRLCRISLCFMAEWPPSPFRLRL